MGLRCLLGHEYANREVEREREERGNEVVVTYRTVETCDRCGERRVVSENKEVRPVRNPSDETVTTGLGGDGSVTPDLGEEDTASTPTTESTGESTEAEPSATTEPADAPTTDDTPADETPSEDVDTGIILDDDDEEEDAGERGRGEWPDADTEGADEQGEAPESEPEPEPEPDVDDGATVVTGEGWPDPEGEDEGFDAEASDGASMDVEFGGGLTPEEKSTSDEADASGTAMTAETANGTGSKQFVTAEGVERVDDDDGGETEFFCPNCGYSRVAGGSSMRAGDICPDCHKGYIGERER
ncbi:DUF7093 family protein [Haloplanus sp. C73]|uniref:DUF7093 family protein n=1 Tax=Haloplanus sp. C73 TaxID=3421641 RepID=UPI003EB99EFB